MVIKRHHAHYIHTFYLVVSEYDNFVLSSLRKYSYVY